jgi:hypothetical protein
MSFRKPKTSAVRVRDTRDMLVELSRVIALRRSELHAGTCCVKKSLMLQSSIYQDPMQP